MQHTNSQRGSDGRFGASQGPKARRIEVWLQPQTVELLDQLTKQWGVGEGKVIDQLLTRGPVAPAAWTATEATPTPSAPKAAPRSQRQHQSLNPSQWPNLTRPPVVWLMAFWSPAESS